jgi:hypothetical protein
MTVAAISAAAGNALLYAWFATVLVSAVYVAYDAFTNNPELTVMKWGWVLVTLYIGPIGASIYEDADVEREQDRDFAQERESEHLCARRDLEGGQYEGASARTGQAARRPGNPKWAALGGFITSALRG